MESSGSHSLSYPSAGVRSAACLLRTWLPLFPKAQGHVAPQGACLAKMRNIVPPTGGLQHRIRMQGSFAALASQPLRLSAVRPEEQVETCHDHAGKRRQRRVNNERRWRAERHRHKVRQNGKGQDHPEPTMALTNPASASHASLLRKAGRQYGRTWQYQRACTSFQPFPDGSRKLASTEP